MVSLAMEDKLISHERNHVGKVSENLRLTLIQRRVQLLEDGEQGDASM